MKAKIYHNPRCSKSRAGLQALENCTIDFEVVKYFDNPLSYEEIEELLRKLNIGAIDLVRTKEDIWKEKYRGNTLSEAEIIQAMVENPKLIERPIIVKGNKAIIGRPSELINQFVNS